MKEKKKKEKYKERKGRENERETILLPFGSVMLKLKYILF